MLVDTGAMLDRFPTKQADKLHRPRYPVSGLGMRLADDRLRILKNYCWLDVVVAWVLAQVKAYEVAVSQTYQLLLSRRWLKGVRADEYHHTRTLFIQGRDCVRRKVTGIPIRGTGVKLESIDSAPFCNVEDDEAEQAIQTLLNELDHWEKKKAGDLNSGN